MTRRILLMLVLIAIPTLAIAGKLEVNESFDVKPGQELSMSFDSVRGDIVIEGWDKDVVEIRGTMRGRDWEEDDRLEFDHGSHGLDITPSYRPRGGDDVDADLTIHVPREFDVRLRAAADARVDGLEGAVEISIANARLELIDVHGEANVSTANGGLEIKDCTLEGDFGSVNGGTKIHESKISGEVATVNGGMRVSGASDDLELESVNGGVDIGTAEGNVKANTTNGRIRIKELAGSIQAETVNGSVRFRMIGSPNGDHSVEIETVNGSVEIEIPENFSLDFDLEVRNEDRDDDYEIISDFDLDIDEDESRRGRYRIRGKGQIGGGKNTVYIRAKNGDIVLTKVASAR